MKSNDIEVAGLISPEIVKLCKDYFNYVEPPTIALVTSVNGNMVTVDINGFELDNVPVLQTGSSIALNINDSVLVVFAGGHLGNPVIVGKIDIGSNGGGGGTENPDALTSIALAETKFQDKQGVCSHMNCFISLGYGDCWADSYWCYDQCTKAGIEARIVCEGVCHVGAGHRWTQVNLNDGKGWVDFPYAPGSQQGRKGRTVGGVLPHPEDHEGTGL